MTYAVHHVDGQGHTRLDDHPDLDAALAQVEALQGDGAVSEVRVLREVPIEVRTYYRVVAVEEPGPASAPVAPAPVVVAEEEPVEEAPAERLQAVASEPPSGAVLMGPPPASTQPPQPENEAPAEQVNETRRALFGRS